MKPQFLSTIKGALHLLRGITWVDFHCEKQRVTGLLYIDAEGTIPFRPAIIDSAFSTGSKVGVIKEIKKEQTKTVKGKKVLEGLKGREYKERF